MPRIKLGRNPAAERVVETLWGAKARADISAEEMAAIVGAGIQTLRRRRKDPMSMTLGEFLRLGRALNVPIEDMRSCIRY